MRLIFLPFMFCMQGVELNAQSFLSKLEFGAQAGSFIYQGDLTPSRLGSFKTPGLQLGLSASMPLNDFLSARANFSFGKIRGDDAKYAHPAWRQHRNLHFSSPVFEVAGLINWHVTQNNTGLAPYLFGGVGLSFLKVRRDAGNFDAEYFSAENTVTAGLNTDLDHSTPRTLLVFPVGAGIRYPLTEYISLNAEAAYRFAFSDYIDGFSQAGNPARKDHYHSVSFGVLYRFKSAGAIKCPPAIYK